MDSGTSAARAEALDLIRVSDSVRRHLLPVSLLALTAAGLTALISRQAPPTYQASSSMVAVRSDSGNSLIDNTLVTAPTLPTGALTFFCCSSHSTCATPACAAEAWAAQVARAREGQPA